MHEAAEQRPERAAYGITILWTVILVAGVASGRLEAPRVGRTNVPALVAGAAFVAAALVSISGRSAIVNPAPTAPFGDR